MQKLCYAKKGVPALSQKKFRRNSRACFFCGNGASVDSYPLKHVKSKRKQGKNLP
jgi:hypothetical protein